ncbi:MAG: hypothetical protein LBD51_07980 [Bifidobacteriaceae bacterium]|nr:hypothetical protein [Bifidobacteriaceae bacterium]
MTRELGPGALSSRECFEGSTAFVATAAICLLASDLFPLAGLPASVAAGGFCLLRGMKHRASRRGRFLLLAAAAGALVGVVLWLALALIGAWTSAPGSDSGSSW